MELRVGLVGLGQDWDTRQGPAFGALNDRFEITAICAGVALRAERAAAERTAAERAAAERAAYGVPGPSDEAAGPPTTNFRARYQNTPGNIAATQAAIRAVRNQAASSNGGR